LGPKIATYDGTPHEKRLTNAMIKNESLIDNSNNTGPRVPVEKHAIVAFIVSLTNKRGRD